jgi:O-antigen ligase
MSNFLPLAVLAGSVIGFLTLINTDVALIVLIFSMLLSPEFAVGDIPGRPVVVRIDDVLILVVFFTWLAKLAITKRLGLLRSTRVNFPIFLYVVVLLIATLAGVLFGRVNIFRGMFYLLKYCEYFMLFFMVTNSLKNQRQIKVFVFFILLTCVVTSLYAMHTVAEYGRATAPFEESTGKAAEPNTLGGYLVLVFSIVAGLLLYTDNFGVGFLLAAMGFLFLVTLGNTLSRGSFMGLIVSFVALAILTKKRKFLAVAVIILAVLSAGVILPKKVVSRVTETFSPGREYRPLGMGKIVLDDSASARVESWKTAFDRWLKSPIIGNGVTGAGFIDTQYPLVLGESGVLGLFAFCWMISAVFKESFKTFKLAQDNYFRGLCLGFIAGFWGLLMHGFSAATFIVVRIMEPFWFLAAVVIMLPEIKEEEGLGLGDGR